MKRFISAVILAAVSLVLLVSTASAQGASGAGAPEMVRKVLNFRKYNNSGINATLTTPIPLDSAYVSHAAARLDTTEWFNIKDCVIYTPNFAPATLAIDTAFVFRLWVGPPSFAPTVSTSDSFYYSLQFSENGVNAIADQNTAVCKGVGITGTGQWTRGFFTLPTCLYSHQSFHGAGLVRFIFTFPASSTTSYKQAQITYNSRRLSDAR